MHTAFHQHHLDNMHNNKPLLFVECLLFFQILEGPVRFIHSFKIHLSSS